MKVLQTTSQKLAMVREFKAITRGTGLNFYMYGELFVQLEQLLALDNSFWQACAVSMAAVYLISLLMGLSYIGALLVSSFSIFLALQIYGALYVFNISYQVNTHTRRLYDS